MSLSNRTRFFLIAIATILTMLASPAMSFQGGGVVLASPGVIVNTGGDSIRLRAEPDPNSEILAALPEGTVIEIVAGPLIGVDGAEWYQIIAAGLSGYVSTAFVASGDQAETVPAESIDATTTPTAESTAVLAEPIGKATIIAGSAEPVQCHFEASAESAVAGKVEVGDVVELLAPAAAEWQLIRCGDVQAFIQTKHLQLGDGNITTETEVSVATVLASATPTATLVSTETAVATMVETVIATVTATATASAVLTETEAATASPIATVTPTATPSRGKTEGDAPVFVAATTTMIVSGTNGAGVRCRQQPSTSAATITTLREGASVVTNGVKQGDWQPVTCAATSGFIFADFLAAGAVEYGTLVNGNGQNIRCRGAASTSAAIITTGKDGQKYELRGGASDDWQPVVCANRDGFVLADYIQLPGQAKPTPGSSTSSSGFLSGDVVEVANTDGSGVRLRAEASTSAAVVAVLAEGKQATVRSGSSSVWVAVRYGDSSGFIHKDYLIKAAIGGGSSPSGGGSLVAGDRAKVTENLRMRTGPSTSDGVVTILLSSTVIKITNKSQNGFYPVDFDGTKGWAHGDYLTKTDAALTPSSSPVSGNAGSGAATVSGQRLVDYALRYLGYPYIWATHGPNSFDCSGLTGYVVKNVLGLEIGYGTWTQWSSGTPVSYGNLRPGDLVFFQNTYKFGLSHVGMYIGNNKFVHAENERTGVVISSLTSNYYSSRWYGARRIV